jgi:hypothetical protein
MTRQQNVDALAGAIRKLLIGVLIARDQGQIGTHERTTEAQTNLRDALRTTLGIFATKNTLTTPDAERVEQAFQAKLASIVTEAADDQPVAQEARARLPHEDRGRERRKVTTTNKSVLSLPAPRRIRDRDHVRLVAKQPCLVCGRRPADAHHLRFAQSRALGRKVSDEFTVPLCRGHHREVHRCGDEAAWWNKTGIDPAAAARVLWLKTHPLPGGVGTVGAKLPNEPNMVSPR